MQLASMSFLISDLFDLICLLSLIGRAPELGRPDRQLRQQPARPDRAARGGGGGEPAAGRALHRHHGLQRLHQQLPHAHLLRAGARHDAAGRLHRRHDRQVPPAAHGKHRLIRSCRGVAVQRASARA
jgi:hypothetical protein